MEKSQRIIDLANKRFSEVLLDGFKLFYRNYGALILPLGCFQVLLIILNIFALTDLKWYIDSVGLDVSEIMEKFVNDNTLSESEWNSLTTFLFLNIGLMFLENLIGAIIITITMCSVSNYILKKHLNMDTNFIQSFKSSFNKKIFLVILIIGICIPLSSLLLFIPAIIIFGFYIFLVFTYNMKDIKNPISEARRVSKGNFWQVIGIFIFNFGFIFIFSYIFDSIIKIILNPTSGTLSYNYNLWLAPSTRNYAMIILYQILVNLVDILLAPLFICFLTSLFTSLKAKKDLGLSKYFQRQYVPIRERYGGEYLQPVKFTQDLDESIDQDSTKMLELEGKFYCPFCGYKIKIPKRFCPNCGESFSFINK